MLSVELDKTAERERERPIYKGMKWNGMQGIQLVDKALADKSIQDEIGAKVLRLHRCTVTATAAAVAHRQIHSSNPQVVSCLP